MHRLIFPISRAVLRAGCLFGFVALVACGGPDPSDEPCTSTTDFFLRNVWGPTLSQSCIGCHAPGGVAEAAGAQMVLLPSQYPNFIDANLEAISAVALTYDDGESRLLQKPLGLLQHTGGAQLSADDPRYQALVDMVALIEGEQMACADDERLPALDDIVQRDALSTYRKATLQLSGRMPTADELQQLLDDGDDAMPELLASVMTEDAFFERLKEIFNDVLLTDKYLEFPSSSINRLGRYDFPRVRDWYLQQSKEDRRLIGAAIAREPLELIAYIVERDRPFTEILTAPYTVVNPFSAGLYETGTEFTDPTDPTEFRAAVIRYHRDDAWHPLPHAGILTRPMFLNRFPTTPTNRNRGRTRMILETFLATDIMEFSDRPVDPLASNGFANPVMEDPGCTVCHQVMDPIAGAFMRFQEFDHQGEYHPDIPWYGDVFSPGYGTEVMPPEQYDNAPAWLAQRIVADPRFPIAIARLMFHALTGQRVRPFPRDASAPDYEQLLQRWQMQDAVLGQLADGFVASNFNLKQLIADIVMTSYYRADTARVGLSPEEALIFADMGSARLLIPEVMARKLEAVTTLPWNRFDGERYLSYDYNILYGGIDSDQVIERLTDPNGVMTNVVWRMANHMACELSAWQLSLPAEARVHLPFVELDTVPEDANGVENTDAVERIKRNIQYLHKHILDEDLAWGDAEIERTYRLFVETWQAGRDALAAGDETSVLHWRCMALNNPYTGEPLAAEDRVQYDPNYTVRSWMAVFTYLLSDYRFIYE